MSKEAQKGLMSMQPPFITIFIIIPPESPHVSLTSGALLVDNLCRKREGPTSAIAVLNYVCALAAHFFSEIRGQPAICSHAIRPRPIRPSCIPPLICSRWAGSTIVKAPGPKGAGEEGASVQLVARMPVQDAASASGGRATGSVPIWAAAATAGGALLAAGALLLFARRATPRASNTKPPAPAPAAAPPQATAPSAPQVRRHWGETRGEEDQESRPPARLPAPIGRQRAKKILMLPAQAAQEVLGLPQLPARSKKPQKAPAAAQPAAATIPGPATAPATATPPKPAPPVPPAASAPPRPTEAAAEAGAAEAVSQATSTGEKSAGSSPAGNKRMVSCRSASLHLSSMPT